MAIKAGLDICDLVEAAQSYNSATNYDYRSTYMDYITSNFVQYVDDVRKIANRNEIENINENENEPEGKLSKKKRNKYKRVLSFIPCIGLSIIYIKSFKIFNS